MLLRLAFLVALLTAPVEPPDSWEEDLPTGEHVVHYRLTPERKAWLDEQNRLYERRLHRRPEDN